MIYQKKKSSQRGAALVISLIMLLVMTLIGITGMQTTVLEEKMAGNFKDKNVALQAAESALRDAEDNSTGISGHTGMSGSCTNGLCYTDANGTSAAVLESNWSKAIPIRGVSPIPGVSSQPKYLIDGVKSWSPGGAGWKYMYRITVVAEGNVGTTQAELRGTYYPIN